ncbi:MAG: NAD(P)/FAD-dependent oxidoreductase [alpha proteobacterium HIMB59]|jgi:predicted Rossmann fold flavoprotein|nr:MAG: NAD(P)/FAD-dependent oxidoreductase [alpha proteobacterium HIMB59]|tara:strand:- start:3086 stop:4273 length:1188 start_codon:yes stop_codon:yes gene_type:complete
METLKHFDVIIIGAGAAGMMCAIESGKRGRSVLLLDHAKKIGEKIRISGGGRCNFTNLNTHPSKFISSNKKFMVSALNQYTHNDFIKLVESHNIKFHEKKLGQLFCDNSSQQIIDMLLDECKKANVNLLTDVIIQNISKNETNYSVELIDYIYSSSSIVVATGGLSIPKIGATKFGYDIAKKFDLDVISPSAALVPLTFSNNILDMCKNLTGISQDAIVSYGKTFFKEGMLFTHRGLSGPSILQISSYWKLTNEININLCPDLDVVSYLGNKKKLNSKQDISSVISEIVPKRLALSICNYLNINGKISEIPNKILIVLANFLNSWSLKPTGTEGYRTAEVTLGGVNTNELSSKTMMSKKHEGLFFIGEVVDVTGHLGGYNFQWAWSSGYVAGQYT